MNIDYGQMKSQTMGVLSNPTIISYSLIFCSTLILGYYTLHDSQAFKTSEEKPEEKPKESEEKPKESEEKPEESKSFFGGPTAAAASTNIFGSPNKEEAPAPANTFGSPNKEPEKSPFAGPEKEPEEVKAPEEPKPLGTGGKKSRRNKKNAKKANKSKKHRKL